MLVKGCAPQKIFLIDPIQENPKQDNYGSCQASSEQGRPQPQHKEKKGRSAEADAKIILKRMKLQLSCDWHSNQHDEQNEEALSVAHGSFHPFFLLGSYPFYYIFL